jgi:hypothetical protein
MNIPDYISPLVAYRVWQWDALGLKSLNNEPWVPGRALEATTSRCSKEHVPPEDACACGIYAAKNFQHLVDIGYAGYGVHGEVYLWGTVVEHRLGWRAQYAYPKSIILPPNTIPFQISEAESRLETLIAYGVDIAIGSAAPIPLWSRQCGHQQAGLDFLIKKRKRWYSYREEERRPKAGDRVAVLGKGIGVIEHVDGKDVHILMWNKLTLRVPRKQIVWNQQNWRWETHAIGTFARGCHAAHSPQALTTPNAY